MRFDIKLIKGKTAAFIMTCFLLLFCVAGLAEDSANQDISDEVVNKVDPSVVAIKHERALGSGFVVTEDGLIISNGHVVRGDDKEEPMEPAKSITVILSDERKFPATVLGFCMNPDVAVLKIECEDPLKPVEFGDSLKAKIGQKVFAVGTPHGLKRTFSSGIFSNVDRTDLGTLTKVFQTDAAINPGNSGGPLFDRTGRVLGINTYGYEGANNLGFTIPAHVVQRVYRDIVEHGRFVRSDLPVFSLRELYDELQTALGVDSGILVEYVMENTPAEKAGLKQGDIIVEQDGKPVSAKTKAELSDYEWALITMKPGVQIRWTVLRKDGGKQKKVTVKAELTEAEPLPNTNRFPGELKTEKYEALGLSFQRIVSMHRVLYGLQDDPGVLVVEVARNTPAYEAGLNSSDIITRVGEIAVSDVASFRSALESSLAEQEKYIDLEIRRQQHIERTALAPYYDLAGKKVVVIVPPDDAWYLDLALRELVAQGASLTVASPKGKIEVGCTALKAQVKIDEVKSGDIDILLLLDGEKADSYWKNETVLDLIRAAYKNQAMLAAVGASSITLLEAEPELAEKKITTSKSNSGQAIKRNAQYTGNDVERDAGIMTTTGFDRSVIRDFLKQLGRASD